MDKFKKESLAKFCEVFSHGDTCYDIGSHLTCIEANALADLLFAFGKGDAAECLLDGHCLSDEEGDEENHLSRKKTLEA
jgi:hypothetical protein